MPGAFTTISVLAFDLDERGYAVTAFQPRSVSDMDSALEMAKDLATRHAGALVMRRDSNPAVGEEGEPIVVFQSGAIGDFD